MQFVIELIDPFMHSWVLFVVIFRSFLVLNCSEDGFVYTAKVPKAEAGISKATVVPSSSWDHCSSCLEAQPGVPDTEVPSFTRFRLPLPYCSRNGGHSPMEMFGMPPAEEALGHPLPGVSTAVASGFGPYVRPSAGHKISGDLCTRLELQPELGRAAELESRAISQPRTHSQTRQEAEECEDTSEQSSRRRQGPNDALSSGSRLWERRTSAATFDPMARLYGFESTSNDAAPHAAYACAHSPAASSASTGTNDGTNGSDLFSSYSSADLDELGANGVYRNGSSTTIRAPSRHATSNAEDVQKRRSSCNERFAQCCQTTWTRPSRSGRSHPGQDQPDRFMEKLPVGSRQDLAGLHSSLPDPGTWTSSTNPGGPRELCSGESTSSTIPCGCGHPHHRDQGRRRGSCGGEGDCGCISGQDQRGPCDPVSILTTDEGTSRCDRCGGECSEATAHRALPARRAGNGRGRFKGAAQAAFCLARLYMTFSYDSCGLCRHWSASTPGLVLKWHNRALQKEDFVSEWRARELAVGLARDLSDHPDTPSSPWTTSWSSRHDVCPNLLAESSLRRTRTRTRHVGFAEAVDVWIGCDDSFRMYHTFSSLDSFSTKTSPWSCPNFNGEASNLRTFDLLATTDPRHGTVVRSLNPHPEWAQSILELLHQEGRPDADDDEPVVFITSYFIDHDMHPHHDQPRLLRFDTETVEWERDVCLVWEDHIDVTLPFDVTIVRPDSPHSIYPDAVATAIVHQRATFERAAALVTTVHIADPITRFTECAHSFPRETGIDAVLEVAQVSALCQERYAAGRGECTLHSGHQQLLADQLHRFHHGIGLHIRVPPGLSQEELEQNFERRVRQRQLEHPEHQWNPHHQGNPESDHPAGADRETGPEDVTSFMARQLTLRDAESPLSSHRDSGSTYSSSSTSSSLTGSSEADDWRQTVIFTLDGRSTSMQLPWHDQSELYSLVANEFGMATIDIIRLHLVLHRPLDYMQVDLHGLLLQRNQEFRPTPFDRLILLDLELHVDNAVQPSPFRRYVRWVPYINTRQAFLQFLGLGDVLAAHDDICFMWGNNIVVPRADVAPMNFLDGDYVKIFVGETDMQEHCISESDAIIEENTTISNFSDDAGSLFQRSVEQFQKAIHRLGQGLQAVEVKTDPHSHDQPSIASDRPIRPPPAPRNEFLRGFHPDDQRRLARLFDQEAFVECEEEGRVAYIETWHIHHRHRVHCREPRSMKLHDHPENWVDDILELWDLHEEQATDTVIHLVQPSPPATRFQCVLAHVIIEQDPQPNLNVGVISIEAVDHRGNSLEHEAHSLPDFMGRNMVLRKAELEVFCQTRICSVSLGALPFGLVDIEEVPRAAGLTIHLRPIIFNTEETDFTDLMQRPPRRWPKPTPTQQGQDLSSTPARCSGTAFVFNPDAPAFDPTIPHIGRMPENVQDLHQAWLRTAFSWEGESPSTMVITWFVDHHNIALHHCQVPRVVRLYDNFDHWENQLRQLWYDFTLPGAPIMIHVVDPHPSNTEEAHVLIIQNPLDQFSTSLVTGHDNTAVTPQLVFQAAITTPETLHYDQFFMALGLGGRCLYPGSPARCTLHYGNYEIRQGVPFPARDGHGLKFRIVPRPTFQDLQQQHTGPVLLQLSSLLQVNRDSERLTTALVAHEQWPLPDHDEEPLEDRQENTNTMGIQLISGCSTLALPEYIECDIPGSSNDIQKELASWCIDCDVFRLGQHWKALCLPKARDPTSQMIHFAFCHQDIMDTEGVFLHTDTHALSDLEIMQFLYKLGYQRAVVMSRVIERPDLHVVEFLDVVQQHHDKPITQKTPPTWPKQRDEPRHNAPFIQLDHAPSESANLLRSGIKWDDLHLLFESGDNILCRDPTGHDFPTSTKQAMRISQEVDLSTFDRIIIYADGSSQPTHRHRPAQWNDEHGFGDTWSFAVIGETYTNSEPKIEVIGWTAQPVRYDETSAFFLGSKHLGSLLAEREAMTWAALWRLSHNINTPTLFRTDSSTTACQATGDMGTQTLDISFQMLRSCFQALESALGERLEVEHVPGHCDEPYNDLVDWLAQEE